MKRYITNQPWAHTSIKQTSYTEEQGMQNKNTNIVFLRMRTGVLWEFGSSRQIIASKQKMQKHKRNAKTIQTHIKQDISKNFRHNKSRRYNHAFEQTLLLVHKSLVYM